MIIKKGKLFAYTLKWDISHQILDKKKYCINKYPQTGEDLSDV